MLRSRTTRREASLETRLPDPIVSPEAGIDPEQEALLGDSVGLAMLVVLDSLTPAERVAFVLHDVFAVPFEEIAAVLGTTDAAARQLASRARRAVTEDGVPRHHADRAEQRRVVAAFVAAAESGDLDALVEVLAPDVVAIGDGGGVAPAGRHPVHGAIQVARFMAGLFRRAAHDHATLVVEPVLLSGDLGLLGRVVYQDHQVLTFTLAFAISGGRITGIFNQVNPAKLTAAPAPDPARALPGLLHLG
jgi:RNA polymerase sigma-70 factor (ECF subfamily)